MHKSMNVVVLLFITSMVVYQGCLGFSTFPAHLSENNETATYQHDSKWSGEYSGNVTFDNSKYMPLLDGSANRWYKEDRNRVYISKKENPTIIKIQKKGMLTIVTIVGEDKSYTWSFTVESSKFSTSSVIFDSSMPFLGQQRICTISLECVKNKLTGTITIEPEETLHTYFNVTASIPSIIERKPGGVFTLDFEKKIDDPTSH